MHITSIESVTPSFNGSTTIDEIKSDSYSWGSLGQKCGLYFLCFVSKINFVDDVSFDDVG